MDVTAGTVIGAGQDFPRFRQRHSPGRKPKLSPGSGFRNQLSRKWMLDFESASASKSPGRAVSA